jgi:uncharacterized membrane protein YphA (DoxX/SURF4 family)
MGLNPEAIRDRARRWARGPLNTYLALGLRLYIGGIFIYASMSKINYAAEFADIIAGYQLVPYWAVNLIAVTLPWAELICGALLIIGVRAKAAAACLVAMLAVFTAAIVINLIRGTPIGCGCFSSIEEPMGYTTLLRDLIWLAMALHVYFFDSAWHLEQKFLVALAEEGPDAPT